MLPLLLPIAIVAPATQPALKADSPALVAAATALADALKTPDVDPSPTLLRIAADLGPDWAAAARLSAATKLAPQARANAAVAVLADLQFRPVDEAPKAPGWPAFTPIGEIEVKHYPAYRAAYTKAPQPVLRTSSMFFVLFRHISDRNIPMTTPVEMGYSKSPTGQPVPDSMAFLYPNLSTGKPGPAGDADVTIRDIPGADWLTLGQRGRGSESDLAPARKALADWLAAHPQWTSTGEFRVLGYNGPGVADDQSYYEVQIPVTPKTK